MCCQAGSWMIITTLGMLLPFISEEFQLSYSQQGLLFAIPIAAVLVLTIPLNLWVMRYRPVLMTTTTLVIGAILVFIQASSTVFIVFIVARLLFGIAVATREPARALIMQMRFHQKDFPSVNGVTTCIISLFFALTLVAIPPLLSALDNDWRLTLYILGAVYVLFIIIWTIIARDKLPQADQSSSLNKQTDTMSRLLRVFRRKVLWIAGLGIIGGTAAESSFLTFYPTLMLEKHNFPLHFTGIVMAVMYLTGGISCLAIGRLAANWQIRSRILFLSGILMPFSFIALLLNDSIVLLLAVAIILGTTFAYLPIFFTVSYYLPHTQTKDAPVAHSFMFTCLASGSTLGPIISGVLQDSVNNLTLVLVLVSLSSLFVSLAAFFVNGLPDDNIKNIRDESEQKLR